MGFSSFKSYGSQVAISKIITIVNNRPRPFIWLKFDDGDITNTTTIRNYGSQGTGATLQKIGTGVYPQLLTTGQSVGTGCISLVGGQGTAQNGGYVSMSPITTTTDGMAFAVWFKFQPDGTMFQFSRLFDFGNAPNTNDLLAYFDDYSNLSSYVFNIGQLVENYNPAFNTGEWFHYAFTIKPNGEWNVYINGTFITTKTIGYPAVKTLNVNDLGKSKFNEPLLTAQLDDFRYYNVPLSNDDVLALYNKTYDNQVIKINNYNFMNPLQTAPYTDISTLPSWTCDQPGGMIISRAGSPFYPSSNTTLLSGYTGDFEQTLSMYGSVNKLVNISQQFFMGTGKYTLSFWASGRADGGLYVTSNVFSIYLGETLLVEKISPSTANWTNYTYTYNALSSGNVTLRIFIQNPSGADSTINFANFSII